MGAAITGWGSPCRRASRATKSLVRNSGSRTVASAVGEEAVAMSMSVHKFLTQGLADSERTPTPPPVISSFARKVSVAEQ